MIQHTRLDSAHAIEYSMARCTFGCKSIHVHTTRCSNKVARMAKAIRRLQRNFVVVKPVITACSSVPLICGTIIIVGATEFTLLLCRNTIDFMTFVKIIAVAVHTVIVVDSPFFICKRQTA